MRRHVVACGRTRAPPARSWLQDHHGVVRVTASIVEAGVCAAVRDKRREHAAPGLCAHRHGLGGLNSLFGDKTSGGSSASSTNMILCTVRHAVHYARVYDTVLVNKVGLTNISNINLFTIDHN